MRKAADQRAINALMDEYSKALNELFTEIKDLSPENLSKVLDDKTEDEDCRSIQTILRHMIMAGYAYIVEMDNYIDGILQREKHPLPQNSAQAIESLKEMYQANIAFFETHQDITLYAREPEKKILVRWGQRYDVDQLMEHAVMHIHRHRRQIVNFKKLL